MVSRSAPRLTIAALGAVTVVAYGACYYAFGVLVVPIHHTTGWSLAQLGAVFGAGLAVNGALGIVGGRVSDLIGTRLVFLAAGVIGAGFMFASSYASEFSLFGVCYAVGCGLVGAFGFYHITQPAAARVYPSDPSRAIVRLTIVGAFAAPIYLPSTAKLVGWLGWRATIRVEALTVLAAFVLTGLIADVPGHTSELEKLDSVRDAIRAAWQRKAFRTWLVATLLASAAADVMLVYQVPAMIAAGLPITTAAAVAGIRGLAQLAGRVTLTPVLRWIGARRTLVVANMAAAVERSGAARKRQPRRRARLHPPGGSLARGDFDAARDLYARARRPAPPRHAHGRTAGRLRDWRRDRTGPRRRPDRLHRHRHRGAGRYRLLLHGGWGNPALFGVDAPPSPASHDGRVSRTRERAAPLGAGRRAAPGLGEQFPQRREWFLANAEVGPVTALLSLDESSVQEHLEVMTHGRLAEPERLGEIADTRFVTRLGLNQAQKS